MGCKIASTQADAELREAAAAEPAIDAFAVKTDPTYVYVWLSSS